MRTYEPHPHKLGCHEAKPARIVLRTGEIIDATRHFRTNTRVGAVHTNCFVQCSSRFSMFKEVDMVRENRCCAVEGGRAVSVCCSVHSVGVPNTSFVHCSEGCSLFKENALDSCEVVR